MRAYWLLSLAFISLPASAAGTFNDKYIATPRSTTISGPVEVPLYTTPWGSAFPCIEVQVGEKTFLFQLGTGDPTTWISGEVAKAAGIEPKVANKRSLNFKGADNAFKGGGEVSAATLPELRIGELVLEDIPVVTEPVMNSRITPDRTTHFAETLDGRLSLPALEAVAWAVLPSKGVVRFVPAADGQALLGQVGGAPVEYHAMTPLKYKVGKDKRVGGAAALMAIDASIGGKDSPRTELFLESATGMVEPGLAADDAATRTFGDQRQTLTTVTLGGATVPADALVNSAVAYYAEFAPKPLATAAIGADVLALFDIAVDPTTHHVTFVPTTQQTRHDPIDHMIAEAEKGLVEAAPKEGDPPKDADAEPWKPDPATLSRLANLHELRGEPDKALAYVQQKKDQDERDCSGWLDLGRAQVEAGDLNGAVASLTQSSQLYHAWWDLPLEKRTEIGADLAKLEPAEQKAGEFYQEPSSCYLADGWLAAALYLQGDLAKVHELAKTRTDLDIALPAVSGNAYLVSGQTADAQAAYRQSMTISHDTTYPPRLGVGVAYAAGGDWATAKELLERYIDDTIDTNAILFYADQLRAHDGDAAALQALAALSARHPTEPATALAYYRQARRTNASADMATAQQRIEMSFGWAVRTASTGPYSANYARHLLDQGNMAEAEKYLALAEKTNPEDVDTWLAKAEVAAAKGNSADTAAALQKAALVDATSPIIALVRAGKFGPTVSTPAPAPTPPPK
jgi:tetratricopeptide (TPR) repeat protein